MGEAFQRLQREGPRLFVRLLQYVAALGVLWIHLTDPGVTGFFAARFEQQMIYGTAFKPYVYRALIGWLTRGGVAMWPASLRKRAIGMVWHDGDWLALLARCGFTPKYVPECITAALLLFASLLLFARSIRRLFGTLYEASALSAEVVALVAIVGLPTMFNYANYLYDFPTIALFTLGLQLLSQERLAAFAVVYAIGLFSKETMVLLAMVFALYAFRRVPLRRYAAFLLL